MVFYLRRSTFRPGAFEMWSGEAKVAFIHQHRSGGSDNGKWFWNLVMHLESDGAIWRKDMGHSFDTHMDAAAGAAAGLRRVLAWAHWRELEPEEIVEE